MGVPVYWMTCTCGELLGPFRSGEQLREEIDDDILCQCQTFTLQTVDIVPEATNMDRTTRARIRRTVTVMIVPIAAAILIEDGRRRLSYRFRRRVEEPLHHWGTRFLDCLEHLR